MDRHRFVPPAPSSHITGVQNVVAYFPEFNYSTYWRLLKRLNTGYSSTFAFQKNKYSTYGQSCHFSPVWFPDGRYTTYAEYLDAWTPCRYASNQSDGRFDHSWITI